MFTRLKIKNLTVFQEADIEPSPGLNVFMGENGNGKTHLLKAGYCIAAGLAQEGKRSSMENPSKTWLQTSLADKLINVFRPESLGRVVRRKQGRERCELEACFSEPGLDHAFSFATQSKSAVSLEKIPRQWSSITPGYILKGDALDDLNSIDSLDEELNQSDRYMKSL